MSTREEPAEIMSAMAKQTLYDYPCNSKPRELEKCCQKHLTKEKREYFHFAIRLKRMVQAVDIILYGRQ